MNDKDVTFSNPLRVGGAAPQKQDPARAARDTPSSGACAGYRTWLLVGVAVVVALAVGVGLGVGLSGSSDDDAAPAASLVEYDTKTVPKITATSTLSGMTAAHFTSTPGVQEAFVTAVATSLGVQTEEVAVTGVADVAATRRVRALQASAGVTITFEVRFVTTELVEGGEAAQLQALETLVKNPTVATAISAVFVATLRTESITIEGVDLNALTVVIEAVETKTEVVVTERPSPSPSPSPSRAPGSTAAASPVPSGDFTNLVFGDFTFQITNAPPATFDEVIHIAFSQLFAEVEVREGSSFDGSEIGSVKSIASRTEAGTLTYVLSVAFAAFDTAPAVITARLNALVEEGRSSGVIEMMLPAFRSALDSMGAPNANRVGLALQSFATRTQRFVVPRLPSPTPGSNLMQVLEIAVELTVRGVTLGGAVTTESVRLDVLEAISIYGDVASNTNLVASGPLTFQLVRQVRLAPYSDNRVYYAVAYVTNEQLQLDVQSRTSNVNAVFASRYPGASIAVTRALASIRIIPADEYQGADDDDWNDDKFSSPMPSPTVSPAPVTNSVQLVYPITVSVPTLAPSTGLDLLELFLGGLEEAQFGANWASLVRVQGPMATAFAENHDFKIVVPLDDLSDSPEHQAIAYEILLHVFEIISRFMGLNRSKVPSLADAVLSFGGSEVERVFADPLRTPQRQVVALDLTLLVENIQDQEYFSPMLISRQLLLSYRDFFVSQSNDPGPTFTIDSSEYVSESTMRIKARVHVWAPMEVFDIAAALVDLNMDLAQFTNNVIRTNLLSILSATPTDLANAAVFTATIESATMYPLPMPSPSAAPSYNGWPSPTPTPSSQPMQRDHHCRVLFEVAGFPRMRDNYLVYETFRNAFFFTIEDKLLDSITISEDAMGVTPTLPNGLAYSASLSLNSLMAGVFPTPEETQAIQSRCGEYTAKADARFATALRFAMEAADFLDRNPANVTSRYIRAELTTNEYVSYYTQPSPSPQPMLTVLRPHAKFRLDGIPSLPIFRVQNIQSSIMDPFSGTTRTQRRNTYHSAILPDLIDPNVTHFHFGMSYNVTGPDGSLDSDALNRVQTAYNTFLPFAGPYLLKQYLGGPLFEFQNLPGVTMSLETFGFEVAQVPDNSWSAYPTAAPRPVPSAAPSPAPTIPISLGKFSFATFVGDLLFTDDRLARRMHKWDVSDWSHTPYPFYKSDQESMLFEVSAVAAHASLPLVAVAQEQAVVVYDRSSDAVEHVAAGVRPDADLAFHPSLPLLFIARQDLSLEVINLEFGTSSMWLGANPNATRGRARVAIDATGMNIALSAGHLVTLATLSTSAVVGSTWTGAFGDNVFGLEYCAMSQSFVVGYAHHDAMSGMWHGNVTAIQAASWSTSLWTHELALTTSMEPTALALQPSESALLIAASTSVLRFSRPGGMLIETLYHHTHRIHAFAVHPTRGLFITMARTGSLANDDNDMAHSGYPDDSYMSLMDVENTNTFVWVAPYANRSGAFSGVEQRPLEALTFVHPRSLPFSTAPMQVASSNTYRALLSHHFNTGDLEVRNHVTGDRTIGMSWSSGVHPVGLFFAPTDETLFFVLSTEENTAVIRFGNPGSFFNTDETLPPWTNLEHTIALPPLAEQTRKLLRLVASPETNRVALFLPAGFLCVYNLVTRTVELNSTEFALPARMGGYGYPGTVDQSLVTFNSAGDRLIVADRDDANPKLWVIRWDTAEPMNTTVSLPAVATSITCDARSDRCAVGYTTPTPERWVVSVRKSSDLSAVLADWPVGQSPSLLRFATGPLGVTPSVDALVVTGSMAPRTLVIPSPSVPRSALAILNPLEAAQYIPRWSVTGMIELPSMLHVTSTPLMIDLSPSGQFLMLFDGSSTYTGVLYV